MKTSRHSRDATSFPRWFGLLFIPLILAGCQTYSPKPLDLDRLRESWPLRDTNSEAVRAFAERINANNDQPATYDPSDGVTLREAEVIALFFNAQLRVARLEAAVPLASAEHAGLWQDPEFSVSGLRVLSSVDDPWIFGAGISITIPLSGRLGAEEDKASAEARAALAAVREQEWQTLADLRETWVQWSLALEQAQLLTTYRAEVEGIRSSANTLRDAGEMTRAEARLFELEHAEVREQAIELDAQSKTLELGIRQLLGLMPDAPLTLVPGTSIEGTSGDDVARRERIALQNARLSTLRAQYHTAEQALRVEITKQYPDLTIGPAVAEEDGQTRLGLGLGIPIPSINLNRQGIAEANAEREAAAARFYAAYEKAVNELATTGRTLDAARARLALLRDEVGPLVDQQVAEVLAVGRLGELDPLLTLDTLRRRFDTKVELLDARSAELKALNDLKTLLGPDAPVADETSEEKNDE